MSKPRNHIAGLIAKATLILSLSLTPWLSAEETREIPVWAARPSIRTYGTASTESVLPGTIPYGQRLLASVTQATEDQPLTQNEQGVEGRFLEIALEGRSAYVFSGDISLFPLTSACTSLADWAKRFGGRLLSRKQKGCTNEELLWKNCDASPQETLFDYQNVSLQIITHSEVGLEVLSLPGGRRIDAFFVGQSCLPAALRSKLDASKLTIADDDSSFCQVVGQMPAYTLRLDKEKDSSIWKVSVAHSYGGLCK